MITPTDPSSEEEKGRRRRRRSRSRSSRRGGGTFSSQLMHTINYASNPYSMTE
jgi:hypothetical protein